MDAENQRLEYLKTDFKVSPKQFNHEEINIIRLFKQRQEREMRLNLKLKLMSNQDHNIKVEALTPAQMDELLKENEDEKAPKVISMKQYLQEFCKQHNIDYEQMSQNPQKLPMHIYLNSAQSGTFSLEYKKGKVFDLIDKSQKRKKEQADEESQQMIKNKLIEEIGKIFEGKKRFKTKWHQKVIEKKSELSETKNIQDQQQMRSISVGQRLKFISKSTMNSPKNNQNTERSKFSSNKKLKLDQNVITSREFPVKQQENNSQLSIRQKQLQVQNLDGQDDYEGIHKFSHQSINEKEIKKSTFKRAGHYANAALNESLNTFTNNDLATTQVSIEQYNQASIQSLQNLTQQTIQNKSYNETGIFGNKRLSLPSLKDQNNLSNYLYRGSIYNPKTINSNSPDKQLNTTQILLKNKQLDPRNQTILTHREKQQSIIHDNNNQNKDLHINNNEKLSNSIIKLPFVGASRSQRNSPTMLGSKNLQKRSNRITFIKNSAKFDETLLHSANSQVEHNDSVTRLQSQGLSASDTQQHENILKRKKLDQIIRSCFKESQLTENDIKEFDYEILVHNLKQNKFQQIVDTLKELEYAAPQSLPVLYSYKERVKEEMDEEENEVSKEYRSGRMDPSSEVAKFEKGRRVKKKVGKKLEMELKFKQIKEQKSIITGINYLSLL
eukprot:403360787